MMLSNVYLNISLKFEPFDFRLYRKLKMNFEWKRTNRTILYIAMLMLVTGFALIYYKTVNQMVLNEEIFNFRRITLAPIFVLFGYSCIAVAIMIKSKY